jgi:hypothetical protein
MKLIVPLLFCVLLLAGFASSCKHNPVVPPPTCDTCKKDTTCDTCKHDTIPKVSDTTSHNFTWTQSTIPGEAGLNGCWVFGPNSIYVVGGSMYKTTDGTHWTLVNLNDADHGYSLNGIISGVSMFALTETDYWLTNGFPIHVTTGGSAKQYRIDTGSWAGPLHSGWGTSSNDMYFVGNGGLILHFDGSTWTKMSSGTTKDLHSIWGTSDQNIWACGSNASTGTTVLLHYNGTSWSEDPISIAKGSSATGGFEVVWACDSAGHNFVVTSGALLLRKTDNGAWRSDSGLIPNRLPDGSFVGIGARGGKANDFIVAGGWGFIAHWNGASWYQYSSLFDYSNAEYGAAAASMQGSTICVVGIKSGSSWVAIGQR